MSCVVGLITRHNKVILAADSQSSDGIIKVKSAISKIVVRGVTKSAEIAIGCVGGLKIGNFARYILDIPEANPFIDVIGKDRTLINSEYELIDRYIAGTFVPHFSKSYIDYCRETASTFESIEDGLLIGLLGRLYYVDSTFGIHVSTESFEAIGSARDLAYGALSTCELFGIDDPYKMIETVFGVTGGLSLYSNGEYNIIEV